MINRQETAELPLEEVLDLLRRDLMEENIPLYEEENLALVNILRNNEQIIGLLFQSEALARLNGDLRRAMGEDYQNYLEKAERFRRTKGRLISVRGR